MGILLFVMFILTLSMAISHGYVWSCRSFSFHWFPKFTFAGTKCKVVHLYWLWWFYQIQSEPWQGSI